MMHRLLAIDPGVTTGVAWADVEPGMASRDLEIDWVQVSAPSIFEHVGSLLAICEDKDPDVIIMEDFILYAAVSEEHRGNLTADRAGLEPVRVTSAFEYGMLRDQADGLWWMEGVRYYRQMASLAKKTVTNKRLHNWGLWQRGWGTDKGKHACDAVKHLVTGVKRDIWTLEPVTL